MALSICNVRTEYKLNPLGMDEPKPRFSYEFSDEILAQKEVRIVVSDKDGKDVWDSGWQTSGQTSQHAYAGAALLPFTRYFITVQANVQMHDGRESIITNRHAYYFETGFAGTGWTGKWITLENAGIHNQVNKFQRFFKTPSGKKVTTARLYITALGLYDAKINGKPVTDACLTPGNTNYAQRVQYQAYDVTSLITPKDYNTLDVLLGSGWYSGKIRFQYDRIPRSPALRCELHLAYDDGTTEKIVSDSKFVIPGKGLFCTPFRYSDIYDGEWYDAFKDKAWMKANNCFCTPENCNDNVSNWDNGNAPGHYKAQEIESNVRIEWQSGAFIRAIDSLSPVSIRKNRAGNYIVDFGQNLTGREHLKLRNTHQGATIVIKHGEMLNQDGSLYIDNMRSAWTTTVYVCGNCKKTEYEPLFTFYGFRYLEISGWPGELKENDIAATVLSSDLEQTGDFYCSDGDLNQLFSNIVWGQCDNFLDIPTDCPQRDERLGWTGDTQVFSNVATYNMGCQEFYTKWLNDMNNQWLPDGSYQDVAPCPWKFHEKYASTGWTDAALVVPWEMYVKYGDTRLLERYFDNILGHYRLQYSLQNKQHLITCSVYLDWLTLAENPVSREYLATAYFIGMTALLQRAAAAINRPAEEIKEIQKMHDTVLKTFRKLCLDKDGLPVETCQTASLLALYFDLLPNEDAISATLERLVDDLRRHDTHLTTGFLGTPLLLPVLTRFGQIDLAYELLFQKSYPGWMFPQTQGATSMWERWNSFTLEKGFGDVCMNSFNHYAYGAVGAWFYDTICGIIPDSSSPATAGFKHFTLAPQPGKMLESANAQVITQHGAIASLWYRKDNEFIWVFQVPGNTTAKIIPPFKAIVDGAEDLIEDADGNLVALPGEYCLTMKMN